MSASELRAVYLTSERLYLRAYVEEDKNQAMAWMATPFPVNPLQAEEKLKSWHKEFWPMTRHMAICLREDDSIVGGASISLFVRNVDISLHIAPWREDADSLRGEALGIVVPWMSEEWDMVAVTIKFPSDQSETIAVAEALGMENTGRFREFYARPGGQRVDQLIYQKLNPKGEFPDA